MTFFYSLILLIFVFQFPQKIFNKIKSWIAGFIPRRAAKNPPALGSENQITLDKKLIALLNPKKLPTLGQLKQLHRVLSRKEKNAIYILFAVIFAAGLFWGMNFYKTKFVLVPIPGGEYTEGVVGAPRYINPLLAYANDPDLDLVQLVFSGLTRLDASLNIVNDMAESIAASEDKKIYTVKLKQDLFWHDGKPVTPYDILFTYESIKDPNFKSPLRQAFRGVKVEKNENDEIVFTLGEPKEDFLELLTVGILPEHIWGKIAPVNSNLTEFNLRPIGSGPWKLKNFKRDGNGNIRTYVLSPFENYYGKAPYIQKLTLKFFQNFDLAIDALNNRSVDGISYVSKDKKSKIINPNVRFYSYRLPQYTAVFFNLKNEILKDAKVRRALAYAVDRASIFANAAKLEGEIIQSPLLPSLHQIQGSESIPFLPEDSKQLLNLAGWTEITREEKEKIVRAVIAETSTTTATTTPKTPEEKNENVQSVFRQKDGKILKINLATIDIPEYIASAEELRKYWQNIGIETEINVLPEDKFLRERVKPRNFQAILYGENYGRGSDPYYFWHSSQAQDPGLNLPQYANRKADKILEDARKVSMGEEKKKLLKEFLEILDQDIPAIFLYSPTYTYAVDEKVHVGNLEKVVLPSDRFIESQKWYIFTGRRLRAEK